MHNKSSIRKFYRRSADLSGLPPGTLAQDELKTAAVGQTQLISVIEYNRDSVTEKKVSSFAGLAKSQDQNSVVWIDIDGISDTKILEEAGKEFEIHPLTLEDILNNTQRPKCDEFDKYLFITLKMLSLSNGQVEGEQLSIVLSGNCVITFQEKPGGDVFNPVRERIRSGRGRIRQTGADYLAYALLDAIIDNYFIILEEIGDRIETLENAVTGSPGRETITQINAVKRELIFLRKSVWPLRELISTLERAENTRFTPVVRVYLRDLYDHAVQAIDSIETFREMSSGMLDIYLSRLSIRLNEIMKLLTIMSSIFIPLTFIAGVYGMNFEHMPELKWTYGYLMVWLLFLAIPVGLLIFFRRRKWL